MSKLRNISLLAGPAADNRGVDRFAKAMREKLERKRLLGRGGWNDSGECSINDLAAMLHDHLEKGDMVDIGNFAMMIWNRQNPEGKP